MGNGQHTMTFPPRCGDFLTFASIRDPVARAVSLYRQFHAHHRDLPGGASFPEFVAHVLEGDEHRRLYGPFFCATQAEYLSGIRIDRLVRLERLRADLEALRLADEPFAIPRVNASGGTPPPIDPQTLARVRAWAAPDYDHFGESS